jgi:hypothetical protein
VVRLGFAWQPLNRATAARHLRKSNSALPSSGLYPNRGYCPSPVSAMRLEMAWRRDVARMKTNLMESAGCKSTSGLARGTFRTGERTFQCKRSMQVSPLPAQ